MKNAKCAAILSLSMLLLISCNQDKGGGNTASPASPGNEKQERVATSKLTVEEIEFQERQISRSSLCYFTTIETYSGAELKEYVTTAKCSELATPTQCDETVERLSKFKDSIDSVLSTQLTRAAQNKMNALRSAVVQAIDSVRSIKTRLIQAQEEAQKFEQNSKTLAERYQKELGVTLIFTYWQGDKDKVVVNGFDALLSDQAFVTAIKNSGVLILNLSNEFEPLRSDGQLDVKAKTSYGYSYGGETFNSREIISHISKQPTRAEMVTFQASKKELTDLGLKIEFDRYSYANDFSVASEVMKRIASVKSQIKFPLKYTVSVELTYPECKIYESSAPGSSRLQIDTRKLTGAQIVKCLNDYRL